jgi:SPP1 gp7 family putative phage head morphogenesis protein
MLPKTILKRIVDDDLQMEYKSAKVLQQNLAEARNNVKSALYNNPDDVYNARLKNVLDKYLDKLPEKTKENFPVDEIYNHGARQGKRILSESANIPSDDDFHGWMPVLPINAISAEKARMADLIQQVSEDLKTKILRATQVGLAQGNTPQQTIDAILGTGLRGMNGRDGIWRKATHRAETIGRSISNELINKGALQTYRQVNDKSPELGLKKVWQAVSDKRTSNICRSLDGQIVEMDENFSGAGFTGETPPAHPNCRSRITTRPAKNWDKKKQKGKYDQSNTPEYTNPKRVPPRGISVFKLKSIINLEMSIMALVPLMKNF